jgi:hypothetical protein
MDPAHKKHKEKMEAQAKELEMKKKISSTNRFGGIDNSDSD